MRQLFLLIVILVFSNALAAQIQRLQSYIEEGHSFEEIYRRADRMVRRHQLEDQSYKEEFHKNLHKKDNQDNERLRLERWAWYWRDRLNDDGSFPDLQRQQLLYKSVKSQSAYRMGLDWKHEGPVRNTGGYWGMGRTTHIDFHPTQNATFFVAAPNGGLWKTTDGGLTYFSLGEDLPQQPVGVVIVDQKNPNNIYISLGEKEGWWQYGLGVYKSTDGGATWKTTGLSWRLTESKVLFSMVMNPRNSSILIAATNNGLYKTYNGGTTWQKVHNDQFSDVVYKPGDTSVVYAARYDYWGTSEVFRSGDGGASWSQVSSFNTQKAFLKLAVTAAAPAFLGVNASQDNAKKFFRSDNSGTSFSFVSDMPENLVFFVSQQNPSVMYCGFVNPYKSTDGGVSWNQLAHWHGGTALPEIHADQRYIGFHPRQKQDIYFCNDGGIHKYNENTNQWTELVNNLPITQFYKMAVSTTNPPAMIGGSQDNGGFIRRANGSWGNTNGGDAMWQEIDPVNPNIGYTEYWGGTAVYRTNNNFYNLTEISQNIPGKPQGQWVTPFGLNPKNPKTFVIGYHDVFVSHNRGDNFSKLSNNLTGAEDRDLRIVRFSPLDTNTILTSYANNVYQTRDYGKNWTRATVALNHDVTDICFHTRDTNKVWLSRAGLGSIKIMESRDRGKTWINATGNFVNTPVLALCYDEASNVLFAGTDIGVFFAEPGVWDWKYYGAGLPNTSVTDLDIHHPTRRLFISTYGRGFYSIDLPDCMPLSVDAALRAGDGPFISKDTLNVCMGQALFLKCDNALTQGVFRWTGPLGLDTSFSSNETLNVGVANLSRTGLYQLTYTSPTGCTRSDEIYIKVNNNPSARIRSDHPFLDCKHASVTLTSSNTSVDFKYLWQTQGNPVSDSSALVVSQPGLYHFQLTNNRTGCFTRDSFRLTEALPPVIQWTSMEPLCYGDNNGAIEWTLSDGRPPFQYSFSDQALSSSRTSLKAGAYSIKVVDSLGCEAVMEVILQQPDSLDLQAEVDLKPPSGSSIRTKVNGGVRPYSFKWTKDGFEFSVDSTLEGLETGEYRVEVTDAHNCKLSRTFIISEPSSSDNQFLDGIRCYPVPARDHLFLELPFQSNRPCVIRLLSLTGQVILENREVVSVRQHKIDLKKIPSGSYILRVGDGSLTRDIPVQIIQSK